MSDENHCHVHAEGPRLRQVGNCARCGGDHENLPLTRFRRPVTIEHGPTLTHWAMCPTYCEPILVRFEEDES